MSIGLPARLIKQSAFAFSDGYPNRSLALSQMVLFSNPKRHFKIAIWTSVIITKSFP